MSFSQKGASYPYREHVTDPYVRAIHDDHASKIKALGTPVDSETPAGVVDGVNASFTLKAPPNPPSSLNLFNHAGARLRLGVDFKLNQNVIVYAPVAIPAPGASHVCSYRKT